MSEQSWNYVKKEIPVEKEKEVEEVLLPINTFKLPRAPYDERKLFPNKELVLEKNSVTCLVGCNGSGKSTAIHFIKKEIEHSKRAKKLELSPYSGLADAFARAGGEKKKEPLFYYLDFNKGYKSARSENDFFLEAGFQMQLSNGEGLSRKIGQAFELIAGTLRKISGKTLYIFFDDCDAGTSIDLIDDFKGVIDYVREDCPKFNVEFYVVITSNSFEMCRGLDCIDVSTFKHHKFTEYEEFKNFVLESRKRKDEVLEKLEKKNKE